MPRKKKELIRGIEFKCKTKTLSEIFAIRDVLKANNQLTGMKLDDIIIKAIHEYHEKLCLSIGLS